MAHKPPTADRLRHDIDRGRSRDKVDAISPTVAPLGTDEEAAGTSVPAEVLERAYSQEVHSATTSERNSGDHGVAIYVSLILIISLMLLGRIWLTV